MIITIEIRREDGTRLLRFANNARCNLMWRAVPGGEIVDGNDIFHGFYFTPFYNGESMEVKQIQPITEIEIAEQKKRELGAND